MGNSQMKTNKVSQEAKKFYCKKCCEIFASKKKHLIDNPKHKEENYFPLPDFPDLKNKKCEIKKCIGSGIFTTVFEIKQENQKKALKWIDLKLAFKEYIEDFPGKSMDDLMAQARSKTEIEIIRLKELNHDNLLKIFDYFWASNSDLFIIMQFGKAMVTKESVNKSSEVKAEWFFQICQAVKYLHNMGIVHKKLNPHNILITDDEKIIISDIGGSQKFLPSEVENTFIPNTKYLPPEVANIIEENKQNPELKKETDIWELGIIYHMMLTPNNIIPFIEKKLNIDPSIKNFDKSLLDMCLKENPIERKTIDDLLKPQMDKKISEIGLGNFVILEVFSQDEFSVVYKAYYKIIKELVSLKVFKETKIKEFKNEKIMLKTINEIKHTNEKEPNNVPDNKLLKLIENIDTNVSAKLIIFLEAASADLASVLSLRIKYKENEIFYILNDLMECLFLLKQKNICHGNIKLSNVGLFPKKWESNDKPDDLTRSNHFTYKLLDYSISHEYDKPLLGMTELYASPELKMVYEGRSTNVEYFQSDMYAVGILCLKLMGLKSDLIEKVQNDLTILEEYKEKYPNLIIVVKDLLINKTIPSKDWKSFREVLLKNYKVRFEAPYEKLFVQRIQFQKIEKFDEELCTKYAKIHYNKEEFPIARKYLKLSQKGKILEEDLEKLCEKYEKTSDFKDFEFKIQFENPPPFNNGNEKEATVTAVAVKSSEMEKAPNVEPDLNVNNNEEDEEDTRTIDCRTRKDLRKI